MNDHAALGPWLRRLTSRSALSDAEQRVLLDLPAIRLHVQTNRDFVKIGQTTHHACLVVEGLVGRFGQTRKGARQITALYLPGDMADLHSVVVPKTDWALQALSPTIVVQIPHEVLERTAAEFPAIGRAFWRDCVVDGSIMARWHVSLGRSDARARLAHLMCELAVRSAIQGRSDGRSFDFWPTQTQVADISGMTSVHVNRTLGAMKRDGLIALDGHRLQILDWTSLKTVADFNDAYLHLEKPNS